MQQTLLGGDGVTGENGATHNTKANSNFTELYGAAAAAQSTADSANSAISGHISDGVAAHAATAISVAPFGTIGATELQAALEEIAAEAGSTTVPDASTTVKGIGELLTQAEMNAGTDTTRFPTAVLIRDLDRDVTALSDSSTTAISADKWTWASSAATRTMTFTFAGDKSDGVLTLSAATMTITFPAAALVVSSGVASGNNVAVINGVSGDKYYMSISKIGSAYYVVIKNFGQ